MELFCSPIIFMVTLIYTCVKIHGTAQQQNEYYCTLKNKIPGSHLQSI